MPVATRWPLVGRRDELDVFTRAVDTQDCQGLCIYGPSGVGKTRLGDECLAVAETVGRRILRATAERSDDAVPLGAVAHLLPADALPDWRDGGDPGSLSRTKMLETAVKALTPTADESGRPVLLVDDAHRFDRSSLTVVNHLMACGAVFCVATVNSGEAVPDTVTGWWRDERVVRIDLDELDPIGVDTLLHVVLEGPLDGSAAAELWRVSGGNLLLLHELVLGALAEGSLDCPDGIWRLDQPFGAPNRLRDVVERRIDRLAPPGRAVIELLALCEPVALGQLESSFGLEALEVLERDGLIVVRTDGRRHSVTLAHPLHGEVVRAGIPMTRARSIMSSHADALERFGARRREDPVRIATLRLEATGRADPDLLLRAARAARGDNDLATVARLARAAFTARPTAVGGLVLGDALHRLGSFEEAETVLAAAMEQAAGDDEVASITTVRRRNLFFGCRRPVDGATIGPTDTLDAMSASAGGELLAGEAEILAYAGRPLNALALLQRVDVSDPRVDALAASARAAALAMIGRTAEALAVIRRTAGDGRARGDPQPVTPPRMDRVNELFALVQAGALDEADERGRIWFENALEARMPLELMWLAVHLARGALAQGRPLTALEWAGRASSAIDAHRFEGLRPIATAVKATAAGLLGDASTSRTAADELDGLTAGFDAFAAELPLGRAWALIAAGDRRSARDLLLAAADRAERSGFVPAAGWLLHDAARVGAVDADATRLAALAAETDSALVQACAEHAAALVTGDGDRLAASGERFESIGAILLAAEAAAQAADVMWRNDQTRADALATHSATLAARCEGAKTPALARATAVGALSRRERDIAVLASSGLSSRDIAAQLTLSVRTVDNYLGRIYTKLGVSSRAELPAALAMDDGSGRRR